jgi:cellulose synthase/poly-beta-1,6-N-acetylglucosamine synthase-like glycosyltransferase
LITIIVPAYNEEACIVEKLANLSQRCAELLLPHEVLIGSDGSDDNTVQLAREFIDTNSLKTWRVFDLPNEGKCSTINRLVEQSSGDIIISTDSDTTLHPLSLSTLVRKMQENATIGCASSVPVYALGEASIQEKYWSIDLAIRQEESRLGMLIVLNGWLYGFRRQAFSPIPSGVMADDLWIPLSILLDGWQSVQCPQSMVSCERTDEQAELYRRGRVMAGGMDVVLRLWTKLLKHPVLFMLVFAHKVNRWLVTFWLLVFLLSAFFLFQFHPQISLALLVFFFLLLAIKRIRNILITLTLPIFAFLKVIKSKDLGKWEHSGRKH